MIHPHKVFGKQMPLDYLTRPGAYLIAFRDDCIAVIQTPKGYFLPGGGIEPGETDEETLLRECREETGFHVRIEAFVCSAESYDLHPVIGPFHPVQRYYRGKFLHPVLPPQEPEHKLCWLPWAQLRGKLFHPMQNWAVEKCRSTLKH